jgi:uncharacterized protein (DUF2147 family)
MAHTIKKVGLTISGAMLLFTALFAQTPQTIVGKWKGVEEPERQMEIVQEKDGSFSGKVINDQNKESKTGKVILRNLTFDSKTKTFKGKMLPPDKDITMDVTVFLIGNEMLKIESRMLFISKNIYLVRIK